MSIILQGLEHVVVIQDDTLITRQDDEQHIQNLNPVLGCLISSGMQLHLNKRKFMKQPVTFMGCVISAEGISPTEERIEAIKKAPCPENSTQLRAFHRIINIRNLSSILQPLNQFLQKDQEFPWCPKLWIGLLQSKGIPLIPLFLTCRGAWQSKPSSDSWKWHKTIWHKGCHTSLLPQWRIQTHCIFLKILWFSQKGLQSNREGRPSHHFWHDQVLHVPVWAQVHPSNWSQTIAKDDTATLVLATARLQHWSLLLSSYQC